MRQRYIFRRGGVLYFRIMVPNELRALMGRSEVKESLGTTDTQLGKSLALRKAAHYLEAFDRMKRLGSIPRCFRRC
jgi:hypothetical protein